ncbi:MAG: T9SS type A sorting domain-containing protein, partial [Gemmatimonadetes bacterium]|nr:T9SS type A sorting domain-containing protein [Gemmatimonadota bacterium]
ATPPTGLRIYDVSDADQPSLSGELLTSASRTVDVEGSYAYLGGDDFRVVDVSDPSNPTTVGSIFLSDEVHGVAYASGRVYAAVRNVGLTVIDVSNPASPTVIGSIVTGGMIGDLAYANGWAFLVGGSSLHLIDVSDPTTPTVATTVSVSADCALVDGDYLYVGGSQIRAFDVTVPPAPASLGNLPPVGQVRGLAKFGDELLAATPGGLLVVDVSNPLQLAVAADLPLAGGTWSVASLGGGAVLSGASSRFLVADATLRSNPPVVAEEAFDDLVLDCVISGTRAYLAEGMDGLAIYDVTDPASPTWLGSEDTPGNASGVVLLGGCAYVADSWAGVQVIDVSNPATPQTVGSLAVPSANDVATDGQYLYLSTDTGLLVVDLSSPTTPVVVGSRSTDPSYRLDVADGFAYLSFFGNGGDGGTVIIGVSNPTSPSYAGWILDDWAPTGVQILDGLLYLTISPNRLQIFDLAGAPSVSELSTTPLPVGPGGLHVADGVAYVSSGYDGMVVVDVADPAAPVLLGSAPPPGNDSCYLVRAVGTEVLAFGPSVLRVLPAQCATSTSVPNVASAAGAIAVRAVPSPSVGSTSLEFESAREGFAAARIYDATGRLVRSIRATVPRGRATLRWDGRDLGGSSVASGVYFVRVESGDHTGTGRVVIAR